MSALGTVSVDSITVAGHEVDLKGLLGKDFLATICTLGFVPISIIVF